MTATKTCKHFIFEYLGAGYRDDGTYGQRHRCIDCGHKENDVPDGSVMVGHAPGECPVCDKYAEVIPEEQKQRWIDQTEERR